MYRAAAEGCAEMVTRVPSLEQPFVRFGAHAWSRPFIGRFYRSAADRVADRMRHRGAPFRTLTICGLPLVLDVTEFTTKTLYFGNRRYEPKTTDCLARLLAPGGVFVDIGANHGYFSLLASALTGPSGRVFAFEPNPAVFAQLRTHVRLNGFEARITTLDLALADVSDADARLFVSRVSTNSGLSSLTPSAAAFGRGSLSRNETVAVRVETFDRWLATSGLSRVDVVKIDVEGAEHRVVAGMAGSLASRRIGAVVCEAVWDGAAHRALCASGFTPTVLDRLDENANILYSHSDHRVS
jgi:FkbM family methyltransferase